MTVEELAEKLDGMEYGLIIPEAIKTQAKLDGLVIIYGASDDLMELRGAINDEVDVYEGGTVYFDDKGLLTFHDDCGGERELCPYYAAAKKNAKTITAVWRPEGTDFAWMYETDIPHATFRVLEDVEHYCLGIVFSMEDLK